MFRPVQMRFVRAVILSRDKREVLRGLGDLGVLHLTASKAGPKTAPVPPPDTSAERTRCEALIAKIDAELKVFDEIGDFYEEKSSDVNDTRIPLAVIEADVEKIEKEMESLKVRVADAEVRAGAHQATLEQLNSFKEAQLPISELDKFSFLHFAIGSAPCENMEELRTKLSNKVVLLEFPRSEKNRAIIAVTSRTGRFAMETALEGSGFKRETFLFDSGKTLSDMICASQSGLTEAQRQLSDLDLARKGLAASAARRLRAGRRTVEAEISLLEAEEKFPHTVLTTLITGWVPASDANRAVAELGRLTDGRCAVETLSPEEMPELKAPVLLRHSWLLRPFEMLVSGYGLPGYHDVEPTLFVAITYMLMFGMMFGDVGHGLTLLIAGVIAVASCKSRKNRDIGVIVGLAGFASVIFGFIYGSFFGIKSLHKYALWRDPLDGDPMDIMILAVGAGVLTISIGIILNIVNSIRKGEWGRGIFGNFGVAGALFYWGALGLFLRYAAIKKLGLTGIAIFVAIVLPLAAWALYPPVSQTLSRRRAARRVDDTERDTRSGEDSFFTTLTEALVETFETALSYMANTISFVRIAAYAMSHAAVLMATFAVADVIGSEVCAGIPRILVIIAGNLVAITLEGIVAGVQALRLEYYEFFGKFFNAGGEAFKPFRLNKSKEE